MANTFAPTFSGTFDAEMVYPITNYVIDDGIKKYIDSMSILHKSKYVNKMTGFETIKHKVAANTGNNFLVSFAIVFVGDLPRARMQQLKRLAESISGAGMDISFRDDLITDYIYSCRWTNAMEFVENTELLCGGSMNLEAWDWTAI